MKADRQFPCKSLLLLIFVALLGSGCSLGKYVEGLDEPICVAGKKCDDISGPWKYQAVVSGSCEGKHIENDTFIITQSGCDIGINSDSGRTSSGTVDGNAVCINATSYFEEEGSTLVDLFSLSHQGNTLAGNATWSWSNGDEECSGTTRINLTQF